MMSLPDWLAAGASVEAPRSRSAYDLGARVDRYSARMTGACSVPRVVGLLADNSPDWIAIDLAAQATGTCLVPLPGFFSAEQMAHAVRVSGMQALFAADPEHAASLGFAHATAKDVGLGLFLSRTIVPPQKRIDSKGGAQKLTFTSGTTGAPKGVLLSTEQQLATARALASVTCGIGIKRHLCALPLSVLLENVAGVYTAFLLGATCVCPPLEEVGLSGASGFDPERCLEAIGRYEPDSVILLPQMLHSLVAQLAGKRGTDPRIGSLKFVPVGGAKTPQGLIVRARELGLPVYEGYGLTECASVVSVNVPGADRVGTVGRPLPGVTVRVARDGELEIAGRSSLGYVGSTATPPERWLPSGDIGTIDAEGYVSITGRKKNVLVTSFGRNVSPEWPETLLLENPILSQAAVFGDACPYLVAVLVPASAQTDDSALAQLVSEVNARLPDYAQIRRFVRASDPFTTRNGLATANGRVRRDAVSRHYASRLSALYGDGNDAYAHQARQA